MTWRDFSKVKNQKQCPFSDVYAVKQTLPLRKIMNEIESPKPPISDRHVMETDRGPIDLVSAQAAFDRAAAGQQQAFGDFFLARLFGFEITHPEGMCEVRFYGT